MRKVEPSVAKMNTSQLIRDYAQQVAGAFAIQMYQRYLYDVLADEMANEYTLYGGLLSLGRLVDTQLAPQIREAYDDLEKELVEGLMGSSEAPLGTEYDDHWVPGGGGWDPLPNPVDPEFDWGAHEGGGGWGP